MKLGTQTIAHKRLNSSDADNQQLSCEPTDSRTIDRQSQQSILRSGLTQTSSVKATRTSGLSVDVVSLHSRSPESSLPNSDSYYSWHNPKPLDASFIVQTEFPVEACGALLAPVIREIAETCQAPQGLAAHSVLAACSFAVQRAFNCGAIGPLSEEPCSLFILSIAESGDRKSAVDRLASRVVYDWEKSCVCEKGFPCLVSNGALGEEVNNSTFSSQSVALFTDVTYADLTSRLIKGNYPSIGIFSDESGTFFGNYSMTSSTRQAAVSGYVTLFNSGEVSRYRLTDEPGSGKVFNRRLTINLMSQPISIQETLSDAYLLGQGFLPRFLITNPPSLAGTRFLNFKLGEFETPRSGRMQKYESTLSNLLNAPIRVDSSMGVITNPVPVSTMAAEQFVNLYNEFEREMHIENSSMPAQVRPFQARVAQQARRLATILAVMNGEQSVSVDTMVGAFAIAEHSLNTWKNLIGCSDLERLYAEAQQLLDWLCTRPHIRAFRDIQRYGPRFARSSADRLKLILELLHEHHWVKFTMESKTIILNPKTLS